MKRALKNLLRPFYRAARDTLKNIFKIIKMLRVVLKSVFQMNRTKFTENRDLQILVMGNGPSLKNVDIEAAVKSGFELCCVNFFPVKDSRFFSLKPKYYCIVDPAFYDKKFRSEPKHDHKFEALFDVLEKVDWDMSIISMTHQNLDINNPHISQIKICSSGITDNKPGCLKRFIYFLHRHNLAHCGMMNVMVGAGFYFTAIHSKRVLLAGLDMSDFITYVIDQNNDIYCSSTHFYGIDVPGEKMNKGHFENWKFYELLECDVIAFREFHCLSQFAKYNQVELLNLSPNSYVDTIEKAEMFTLQKS